MNELALYRGRKLRVLHGTYEIAGQGLVLARGLTSLGVDARSFAYKVDWDGRISDIVVDLERAWGPPGRAVKMVAALARWARYYEQVSQPQYAHLDIAWMAAHLEGLRTARRTPSGYGRTVQRGDDGDDDALT